MNYKYIVISSEKLSNEDRQFILDTSVSQNKKVLRIPSIDDIASGRMTISQIRPVKVEDLLGREPVTIDSSGLNNLIDGNSIFVSGAAGSIGSELCRQTLKYKPSHLICLDHSEYALFKIQQEFHKLKIKTKLVFIVGDVKNEKFIDNLLIKHTPDIIFHTAAYKHVPLMENINVEQCVYNNVIGTYSLAGAAIKNNVSKFVLISTDKAVNPTNVMGATKRMSEMVCQSIQRKKGTSFVSVRFGNVLGSSGSVIPKFREQISSGGPITVTHRSMTRFFMSIPEATQLVLQSCLLGKRGEIFVLDMGEPVKILELAKNMIKLSGFKEKEIKIKFTGMRPGEKLYEELLIDYEKVLPTPHKKLFIAKSKEINIKWLYDLVEWIETLSGKTDHEIKKELKGWVEEYRYSDSDIKRVNSK